MSKQIVVGICHGPRCADYGGRALAAELREQNIAVEALDCQSLCACSPVARKSGQIIHRASIQRVIE